MAGLNIPRTTGRSVELRAAPNVQQGVDGNALAAASRSPVNDMLEEARKVAVRIKDQDDVDSVFRAETALKTDYADFERSQLEMQGVDAKGAGERSSKWWGEANQKYSEGLTNDRQRSAFERSRVALQMAGNQTLMRHETQQRNKSLQESAMAKVASSTSLAISDPSPARVELSRNEITSSIDAVARLRGDSPEVVELTKRKHLTDLHKGVVMQMADNDPDAAKAYYYTHRKEIDGAVQPVIEKALQHSGLLKTAQSAADEIVPKFQSLSEADAYIEKNFSGEEEKAIKHEVRDRFRVRESDFREAQDKAYGTALLSVSEGRRPSANVWAQMNDGQKAAINERLRAEAKRREAEAKEKTIKTDFAVYDTLNRMAWEQPEQFKRLDLGRFQDRVSQSDLRGFSDQQKRLGTDEGVKGLQTRQQQIGTAIDQMKLGGGGNSEKRGLFVRNANDAIEAEQRILGRPLKYDEVQKVIDQQTMQVSVPGFLWDSKKRAFEVRNTPDAAEAKIVVPDADRKMIEQTLKARGRTVDDATVLRLYKARKGITE